MRIGYAGVLLGGMLLFAAGCKKKEDEKTETAMTMKIDFRYGSQTLVYGQEYTYDTDKKIKIELIKFYVSRPALKNAAGDWVPFDTEYFLVDLEHPVLDAGKFPQDTYTGLKFGVGVDNSRNTQTDPKAIPATDYPTDHPLNAAADMWWSWATGYIFLKFEGRIDANNNGSYIDSEDKTVSYHPGVSDLYRAITLDKSITVGSEASQMTLQMDLEKLIAGLMLINRPYAHPNSTSHPEYSSAEAMMNNFQSAFE